MGAVTVTTTALSYDDLAQRLGVTVASARRLVHRRRWQKSRANDGRALVQVPQKFLDRRSDSHHDDHDDSHDGTPGDSHPASHQDSPDVSHSDTVAAVLARLTVAQAELVELAQRLGAAEDELATLRPERERAERRADEAATVPVLREALSELKAEREHWQLLAMHLMQRRRRWWSWRRAG
jgi:hypothetical protein